MTESSKNKKTSQSKKSINPKNFLVPSINNLNNLEPDVDIEAYRNAIAELFLDENLKEMIRGSMVWAGGDYYKGRRPYFTMKNLRTSMVKIAFFFIRYHYKTLYIKNKLSPTYDGMQQAIGVSRASIADAIRIFEVIGGLEVTRRTDNRLTVSSEYEVNVVLLEKFILDNNYLIEFSDDQNGNRVVKLVKKRRPRKKKLPVDIHILDKKEDSKSHIVNYNYNIRKEVNKNRVFISNGDKKSFYKIPIKEIYQNRYTEILKKVKESPQNLLSDKEITQSMNAFMKMCEQKEEKFMSVNEFVERIKAWIYKFNQKLIEFMAKHGEVPRWKSLRIRIGEALKGQILNLTDDFYQKVIDNIKKIKRARGWIPSRDMVWKAKELVSGKDCLIYSESIFNIVANYTLNLNKYKKSL